MKKLWQPSPPAVQGALPLEDYHRQPDRSQARLQVIKLYYQGWTKRRIRRVLHVSRPTVRAWICRFEAEHWAGLGDKRRAPKAPARQGWLALMMEVYHLPKRHPDAGGFRLWSLRARPEMAVRTVERIMALNRQLYDAIPHVRHKGPKPTPQPQPQQAEAPHHYGFMDGRQMDFALEDGVKWGSLIILHGSSRTRLAGAGAPVEARWVALMGLQTACLRQGAPEALISDSGGAFPSNEVAAVCTHVQIAHQPMERTKGESYRHWRETHCNVPRRLYDYQLSLTTTPLEFEPAHQAFLHLSNPTAHQGLLKTQFAPPIPLVVLGEATGRTDSPEELDRQFSRARFPRTTNRYGCGTLPSEHFSVEQGVPHTQVLLGVSGEPWRAVFDNVVIAEQHGRYDWREQKITDSRDGVLYSTRFASPQGTLIPLNPQESLGVYRPRALRRPARKSFSMQQLLLFELVRTA